MQHPPIYKELFGPCLLLLAALVAVHHSPSLQQLIAGQAADLGCHQGSGHSMSHDHAKPHAEHGHEHGHHHHHHAHH